ncbi:MAG: hypothetical protein RLZZ59_876 [Pseudomonadota bacterium]|jgi:cell division protein ZapA
MSVVTIALNGKQFQIGCNDGEEGALIEASQKLSQRIDEIKSSSPKAPTDLLLVFCAIFLQEENDELKEKLKNIDIKPNDSDSEDALESIANRLESIAKKIVKC